MKTRRFTIDIPEDIHEEFKTVAFFTKATMKDIVMGKIKEVIKEYKEKERQKETLQSK